MIYIATDHRGFKLKNQLKQWLSEKKIKFKDLGAYKFDRDDDFPDYAKLLSNKVMQNPQNKGIIFCGSGAGVSIACNKYKGIRSAIGFNHQQVRSFTEHDHVNVLAISADHTSKFKCFQLVKVFINTKYNKSEKYQKRVNMMENI